MKVRVSNITYCIEPKDSVDPKELPSVLFLCVDTEDDVADAISDKTGWLVEGFEIDVMEGE